MQSSIEQLAGEDLHGIPDARVSARIKLQGTWSLDSAEKDLPIHQSHHRYK